MRTVRWVIPVLATAAMAAIAVFAPGCSDEDDEAPPAFAIAAARIVTGVGLSELVPTTVAPEGGVAWEVLGDAASVDGDGVITGEAEGVARLVATPGDGSVPDTCVVIVAAAFFDFEGGWTDATGRNPAAVTHGAVLAADRHDRADAACSVGQNAYLTVAGGAASGVTTAYTLVAWLRWDDLDSAMSCWIGKDYIQAFAAGLSSGGSDALDHPVDAGVFRCMKAYVGGVATNFTGGTDFTCGTGRWYHVAVTFDDAADLSEQYVDGVLDQSLANPRTLGTNVKDIAIGRDVQYGDTFIGRVDDVGIFSRRLTAAEIALLYGS